MNFFPKCNTKFNDSDYTFYDVNIMLALPIHYFMINWVKADCWGLVLTKKGQEPKILHNSYKHWALYKSFNGAFNGRFEYNYDANNLNIGDIFDIYMFGSGSVRIQIIKTKNNYDITFFKEN